MRITSLDAASSGSRGTRTRAGNNMSRSRAGILAGASESILKFGTRKTTMGDIARIGGVAKATLYNHFRDKAELYAALVEEEAGAVVAAAMHAHAAPSDDPLVEALAAAATAVSQHAVLQRIAQTEPAVLGLLLTVGESRAWQGARAYAAELVGDRPPASVRGDLALRWVASYVGWPAEPAQIRVAATAVAAAVRAQDSADYAEAASAQA